MKTKSTVKPEVKPEVAATPAPAPTKVRMIKVLKKDAKFRGAREAWYKELIAHDGKPLADYEKACTDKPPSVPAGASLASVSRDPGV